MTTTKSNRRRTEFRSLGRKSTRRRRLCYELLEDRRLLSITPLGDEFAVNDFKSGPQRTSPGSSSIAIVPGNGFAVAFAGEGRDDANGVFLRRFNGLGQPTSLEAVVNDTKSGNQEEISVAVSRTGELVAVWSGKGTGDNDGIFVQLYRADGIKNGGERLINLTTFRKQERPVVAIGPNGQIVVAWSGYGPGDSDGVFLQRFSDTGIPIGGETRVNATVTGPQSQSSLAIGPDGRILLAWSGAGTGDSSGIFLQRFDQNGSPIGTELRVNSTTQGQQESPSVAVSLSGDFVVAWNGGPNSSSTDIFFQRFKADGTAQGIEQRANVTSGLQQNSPSVGIANDRSFVIVWTSKTQDGGSRSIRGREFNSAGQGVGDEFQVNTTAAGPQQNASIAMEASGNFVVAWSGVGVGDDSGVFARRFRRADTIPPVIIVSLANDTGNSSNDRLTSDPSIQGSIDDASPIASFRAGLDSTVPGGFVDVLPDLRTDKTFTFSPGRLAAIYGGPLADGLHTLHLQATDSFGNASFFDLVFKLDTQAPMIASALVNDSGRSSNDKITRDPSIGGSVTDASPMAVLRAGFDGKLPSNFVSILADLQAGGALALSPSRLNTINGSPLADGPHTLHIQATDAAGNIAAMHDFSFVLDTTAPISPRFDLAMTSDSGVPGDQQTQFARVTLVGSTEPSAELLWVQTNTGAVVSNQGAFFLTNVSLSLGANPVTLRAFDAAGNTAEATRTFTRISTVTATDPVIDWNLQALEAIRLDAATPPEASRTLAIMHSAILDAVNAIDRTPGRYVSLPAKPGASATAAVAAAAHRVLSHEFPAQQSTLDAKLNEWLGQVPAGQSKTDGITLGTSVADAILKIREHDGYDAFLEYYGKPGPGQWQPTAPMYAVPLLPQWGNVQPFVVSNATDLLPSGPPELTSQQYADALNEVKTLGAANSTTRTADQTQIAKFWGDGLGTYTPPGHWNQIAEIVSTAQGSSLADNARMFAALNVGLADAAILSWKEKYTVGFWRPITAIQQADTDGNDKTAADSNWTPLLVTPPFPEYISGHSTFSGAAATILNSVFGTNVSFTLGSFTPQNFVRSFTSFDQAATEASRSRIYGGIHYSFSGEDGLALGRKIGQSVIDAFSSSADNQPPAILIDEPPTATATNFNIQGQILDNLAGLAQSSIQIDDGSVTPVSLDAQGRFTLPTGLAIDHTADGTRTYHFRATDASGNTSTRDFSFILDTINPQITISSLAENAALTVASRLVGIAKPTGSNLISLRYSFDAGRVTPIVFNSTTGSFDEPLDLSRLASGDHQLLVSAVDQANNTSSVTFHVILASRVTLSIIDVSPSNGADDVGVTFRPKVFFSRPIDVSTLNADNFYATDTTGAKLTANIVPATDGTFAWLFFNDPMPGASTITINIDGASIRDAEGALLDAEGLGTPGGFLRSRFTTGSMSTLPGTSLVGVVADPGEDLKPMTFDDLRVGPDGVLMTGDDIYLNPIAHAKVFILGLENEFVYTDEVGRFSFASVPSGNVKLAIDGRTATNAPTSTFFPEMVMDLDIEPGRVNTVMGSMGSREEQQSLDSFFGLYLPRLGIEILKGVDANVPTTIAISAAASPNLTPEQRSLLSIQVQPGSLIGFDGKPLAAGKVGISTVPPELVREMLPQGLMQLAATMTIQAPGVATFSQPLTMTFPNVYGAEPGTKLSVYSFDHTTGRLIITGTATVSADGRSASTDPGSGITVPGWHGVTPPGSCSASGGAPPQTTPTPLDTSGPPVTVPLPMIFGETGSFFGGSWNAPPLPANFPPPPPPPRGCPLLQRPSQRRPYLSVTITIDGPLAEFMDTGPGSLPLTSQSFTLMAGSTETKRMSATAKPTNQMFQSFFGLVGGGISSLDANVLYGSKITITEVTGRTDGSRHTQVRNLYLHRFIDATDERTDDHTISFEKTITDGPLGITRHKTIELRTGGASSPIIGDSGVSPAFFASIPGTNPVDVEYDPSTMGDLQSELIVTTPEQLEVPGRIQLAGKPVAAQKWYVDTAGFENQLASLYNSNSTSGTENALIATSSLRHQIVTRAVLRAEDLLQIFFNVHSLTRVTTAGTDVVRFDVFNSASNRLPSGAFDPAHDLGYSDVGSERSDIQLIKDLITMRPTFNESEVVNRLSNILNKQAGGTVDIYLDQYFKLVTFTDVDQLVSTLAKTIAHELGHHVGLRHTFVSPFAIDYAGATDDIMAQGEDLSFLKQFIVTPNAFKIAIGASWSVLEARQALDYFEAYVKRPNPTVWGDAIFGGVDGNTSLTEFISGPMLRVSDGSTHVFTKNVDFGPVNVDGSGGTTGLRNLRLENIGNQPIRLSGLTFHGSTNEYKFSNITPGTTLQPGGFLPFTITFDPTTVGAAPLDLLIQSNSGGGNNFLSVVGFGQSSVESLALDLPRSNLGGVPVGASVTSTAIATIANHGAQTLSISSILVSDGGHQFTLNGIPADLISNPIKLPYGESFRFGVSFVPDHLGLQKGTIAVTTNNPTKPILLIGVTGTGLEPIVYPKWGNDFVAIETTGSAGAQVLRTTSDSGGNFSFFLPQNQSYHMAMFDPVTGLVSHSYGKTSPSGQGTDLTASLVFQASIVTDSDGDGLPDDVEWVVGTSLSKTDTDGDGVSDFNEILVDTDPLNARAFAPSVVGSVRLSGEPMEVVIEGSTLDPQGQTAYVATGTYGLAIVDTSQFQRPILRSQLDLPGTAVDVAVDSTLSIAVVASTTGVHFVDVLDPFSPKLIRSINDPATEVEVSEGVVYVGAENVIRAYDMLTGQLLDFISLGTANIASMAREGQMLYAIDTNRVLRAIDASTFPLVVRGSLLVPVAPGKVFVGNGLAYIGAGQGFMTVDVSNPNSLRLVSGVDSTSIVGRSVVANGSGKAIAIGKIPGPIPGQIVSAVDILNVTDASNTANLISRISVPSPTGVALAAGIVFVANSDGLQVVNPLPFDNLGQPPVVIISSSVTDFDLNTPGIQIPEGVTVPIKARIIDDVQVRNVELLVNGLVVRNDVSFPFELSAIALSGDPNVPVTTVQVRATDTGGNVSLSNVLTLDLVADTFAPTITSIDPPNGASRIEVQLQTFRIRFNEPMASSSVNANTIRLRDAGGNFKTASNIQLREDDRLAQLTVVGLLPGTYQLVIAAASVTDRVGNPLGTADITSTLNLISRATLTTALVDADPVAPGLQIVEGRKIPLNISLALGVFPQSVEFLVNDAVVNVDTTSPYSYNATAPNFTIDLQSITVKARVKDSGGYVTTTNAINIGLIKDAVAPLVVSTLPANGSLSLNTIQTVTINFSEPLDRATVTRDRFTLANAGTGEVFGDGNDGSVSIRDIEFLNDDATVRLTLSELIPGNYQIQINSTGINDRFGNALVATGGISTFSVGKFYTTNEDVDTTKSGIQMFEGTTLPLFVNIPSNVSVQKVELISTSTDTDTVRPYQFTKILPNYVNGSFTSRARVTLANGSQIESPSLTINLLDDSTSPTIIGIDPADVSIRPSGLQRVEACFSEPMAIVSVGISRSGTNIGITSQQYYQDNQCVSTSFNAMNSGVYQLTVFGVDRGNNTVTSNTSFSLLDPFSATVLRVTNTNDSGFGTLREAILISNSRPGKDTIVFDILGTGPKTINVLSPLPTITDPVTIDGTTQPGFVDKPIIELNGAGAGFADGLTITAGGSTIRGLVINRFTNSGIVLRQGGNNLIVGNFIGTDISGTIDQGNGVDGVRAELGSSNNTIGGLFPGLRNVISGNNNFGTRLITSKNNILQGNFIGTDVSGTKIIPNSFHGVELESSSSNNMIGGTTPGAGNVISGNNSGGVLFQASNDNFIQGNLIGTDLSGTLDLGNTFTGLFIKNGSNNTIGGKSLQARNIISGNNNYGVAMVGSGTSGNLVQGNFIGTDVTGTISIPNLYSGIYVGAGEGFNPPSPGSASSNIIGGTELGARNLISGNANSGIQIIGVGATNNQVLGNYIGTDVTGTMDLGNKWEGVVIQNGPTNNIVGGTSVNDGNLISGNDQRGIVIYGSGTHDNTVMGNYIGTDYSGSLDIGNAWSGVDLFGATSGGLTNNNTVGGTTLGSRNVISGNDYSGVSIYGAGTRDNLVQGNYIGTDVSGTLDLGNRYDGVAISTSATNNTIGGTSTSTRNVISGNDYSGISIFGTGTRDNLVQGNYIGTDVSGTLELGNRYHGVAISDSATNNTVGGTSATARNIISGNNYRGVVIYGIGTRDNFVQGNYIGTDVSGKLDRGNRYDGVAIAESATNNTVGGTSAGARNVISGNEYSGVSIFGTGTRDNLVQGNYIGTDVSGTLDLGNSSSGVYISNEAGNNTIGGLSIGSGNLISGNKGAGVYLFGAGVDGNVVQGNLIGTDISGAIDLGNSFSGVNVGGGAKNNRIGGEVREARNIISGNDTNGVSIFGTATTNNLVQGNYIGTDVSGTKDLGNTRRGIYLGNAEVTFSPGSASNNTIGGSAVGAGNLISGNNLEGIIIHGLGATGNVLFGNLIGTDLTGTKPIGNALDGVLFETDAKDNFLGGITAGMGNIIAFNLGNGVRSTSGSGNAIRRNSIFANAGLGIDLGTIGVTPNDLGDGDSGANMLQNYPDITSAVQSIGTATIRGSINSNPNAVLIIDVYSSDTVDPSGFGEGQLYLGSVSINTDAAGNASFEVTTTTPVAPTSMITATATDASGNTSEFSRAIGITPSAPPASRQVQAVQAMRAVQAVQPAMDLNGDGVVTPLDVLLLVNYLNSNLLGGGKSAGTFSFDVNLDGFVNPLDVLVLINELNTSVANLGEGEGPTTTKQDSVDAYFAEFASDPSQSGDEPNAVTEVFAELADEPIGLVLHHRRLKAVRRSL